MNPKSKIAKGKRFENFIAKEIVASGLGKARREIGSGSGKYKGDINCNIPFLIEAKNQKQLAWWKSIDQAKEQARIGNYDLNKWALVVRDPRTLEANPDCYVVIDFWEWLELLKRNKEPKIKKADKEMSWKLKRLIQSAKQVLKELEN